MRVSGLSDYRVDGLRVDAVASMLYLDYSRNPGEWIPNRFGGNENLEAIDFLRHMNEAAYANAPGIVTIAEESTAWGGVSKPTYTGGLGFGFKWNMGWMNDTLRYMSFDPVYRRFHHNDLTFGMLYAFSENFILPLSHDEVVHGKGSLIGRMPGDRWQRFANLRAYFGFMWSHPGKKLLFMGGEFGQENEWNHDQSLDWHLLEQPEHEGVRTLIGDLNRIYRALPALHQRDCVPEGFEWLIGDDADDSVVAFAAPGRGTGRFGHRRLQFHAGATRRLSNRRTQCRPLPRSDQHRFRRLWRQQYGQSRRRRIRADRRAWPRALHRAHAAAAVDNDLRIHALSVSARRRTTHRS